MMSLFLEHDDCHSRPPVLETQQIKASIIRNNCRKRINISLSTMLVFNISNNVINLIKTDKFNLIIYMGFILKGHFCLVALIILV